MNVDISPPGPPKKTSPWVWVGLGCGGLVFISAVLVVGLGMFFYGKFRNFEKQFKDPAVREQRVREVLGAQDLPDGYYAVMTFSIPWVMDMAMLSDHELIDRPEGESSRTFEHQGFIYVRMPFTPKDASWQEFLDGKRSPDELLRSGKVRIHQREKIGRGSVPGPDGATYHYVATRGEIEIERNRMEGITTLIAVECPSDRKFRLGIWFGPDPSTRPDGGPTDSEGADRADRPAASYAGTPADESAIKEFMSHFSLCK